MYRTSLSPYSKVTSSYIATSPTRINSYLEALERDQTISNLRREYSHHRSIQREYEDLKYQISKAERQSKKLEQQNLQIQQDYMDKIKCNKGLISELGSQIQQVQLKIQNTSNTATNKKTQNQKLIDQLKQTKVRISDCEEQNKKIEKTLQSQQTTVNKLGETLDELMGKKKQTQNSNKAQSQIVDGEFGQYKTLQERVKAEEAITIQLKQQLNILKAKKSKLQLRVEQVQQKMKDLKKKYDQCEFESEKLGARCHQAEKESSKVYAEASTLKQNIQQSLTKNKDHTSKLKSLQVVLKENINGLCVKHTTKEKMAVELSDLTKDIEKAVAIIKAVDQETEDQEANNKGLITNLKKSIQSDQQAVKALTRKAAILNLISQS